MKKIIINENYLYTIKSAPTGKKEAEEKKGQHLLIIE